MFKLKNKKRNIEIYLLKLNHALESISKLRLPKCNLLWFQSISQNRKFVPSHFAALLVKVKSIITVSKITSTKKDMKPELSNT